MEQNVENVVEETTQDQVVETKADESKFDSAGDDTILKVDLSQPPPEPTQDEIKENNPNNEGVVTELDNAESTEKQEEIQPQEQTQEAPVLEEVTNEEVKEQAEELTEEIIEAQETGKALPENLQKVVDFMEDTGGSLEDYVKLNQDYASYDNDTLLREYYSNTKPHLDNEEISFLMEDQFSYDEDADNERDIKRKKLALKEQVADAKAHLDRQKSKYYEEIKAGSKLTTEQQKAVNFFDRYNKESEESQRIAEKGKNVFVEKTNQVFNNEFKGFDYNVGDKRYRYNVKNPDSVKQTQSDINNFVQRFTDKNNGQINDAKGYHKSLFTAMNPDAIANHFYEQGKADAMKNSVAKSKNVSMNPRQSFSNENTSGMKVRIVNNQLSDTATFKFKNKNK
jgi:hypothetical protein|tara:strand:+ start:2265 stop:3452 length:1188 start_codon:yes stop_codon:yes gene_type:complete